MKDESFKVEVEEPNYKNHNIDYKLSMKIVSGLEVEDRYKKK